jgi:putative FmdB family regulatory protein
MPIYEYRCQQCGERVEIIVRSGTTTPSCPHCGTELLERLFATSFAMHRATPRSKAHTCCGKEERCDTPPCSTGGECRR